MTKAKPIPLVDIAARINAHLKRFEHDRKINAPDPKYRTVPYYFAGAYSTGKSVAVTYISYQHTSKLKREDALLYLVWLDAGNVGTHYEQQRAAK
jgi:hypothetical protein